jgi:murein L,D-transpeptidase YcbB/YkuD
VKVKKGTLAMSAVAVLAAGVSAVALAETAQAATTCNARVLRTGLLSMDGTYGSAGVPTIGTNPSCRMRKGLDTGDDVARSPVWWLQLTLNQCYGQSLTLDGDYGAKTAKAVKAAQAGVPGLAHDGVYGPRTRSALKWYTQHTTGRGRIVAKCLPYANLT